VLTVRWDLKEAAGKALARRTGIAYEASVLDKEASIFEVQYLYGKHMRRCGGDKREGGCTLPGEICQPATVLLTSRGVGKGWQKSAEAI
jgi:hypothetical protein